LTVSERPLLRKADIPLLFCSGVTKRVTTILTLSGFAPTGTIRVPAYTASNPSAIEIENAPIPDRH